jgi:arginyl-tRNA synthetase
MVELPEGKMKSREGTVVDADDLIRDMIDTARAMSDELGKLDGLSAAEIDNVSRMVGLGALKYFILKVDPKKTMLFDPRESIDFNGNTGPFIQYTHARIQSVLRRAEAQGVKAASDATEHTAVIPKEIEVIKLLTEFRPTVALAAEQYSPALVAGYLYELVREFNQYYHDHSILNEPDEATRAFRLLLSAQVARTVKSGMALLGIEVPDRM